MENIEMSQLLSDNMGLYQVKWTKTDEHYNQKGATVRIPSYIMALGRCGLSNIMHALVEEFGTYDMVCYTDTDSVFAAFDTIYPELNAEVQRIFDEYLATEDKQLLNVIGGIFEASEFVARMK